MYVSTTSAVTALTEDDEVEGNFIGKPAVITATSVTVTSLNLAHGRGDAINQILLGASTIRSNLDEVGAILRRLQPHVVALQEADGPSAWSGRFDHVEYLAKQSELPFYAGARHSMTPMFQFGTAFLAAVALHDVRSVKFSRSLPTLRKGFLRTAVLWNPDNNLPESIRLNLISVHLDFSRRGVRAKQAEELVQRLSPLSDHLILMGDLNADWVGGDPTVRHIASTLGLHPYRPDSLALGTYRPSGRRLDWILISKDLVFHEYRVIREKLSDHFAVSARIGLR